MRFRLRTLFLLFVLAAVFLSLSVKFVRWAHSRPGKEGNYVGEVAYVKTMLGDDALQELRIWDMYGFEAANLWTAKVSGEAIECLKTSLHLRQIAQSQMPVEFWEMPP